MKESVVVSAEREIKGNETERWMGYLGVGSEICLFMTSLMSVMLFSLLFLMDMDEDDHPYFTVV